MKILARFRKKDQKIAEANVTDIAKTIGPLLDDLANNIFLKYRDTLIAEPITYIVPAVWGAAKDANLSDEQKDINLRVVPVVQQVFEILHIENLSEAQTFALGFIVRGLIISKITYMIEALKNKLISLDVRKKDPLIKDIEPMGRA
jgi:hypothetical protein